MRRVIVERSPRIPANVFDNGEVLLHHRRQAVLSRQTGEPERLSVVGDGRLEITAPVRQRSKAIDGMRATSVI